MTLDQFIYARKRETQYGNPATATDQAAKDILASINDSLDHIAKNWLFDWLYEPITIALAANVEDYTLPINIRKLIDIFDGKSDSLTNITLKEYHKYKKPDTTVGQTNEGDPGWYMYIGRAANGARKIRVGNIPTAGGALTGFGKLKLTRFTEAQLGTGASMLPFPEDGEDILKAFVLTDIYRLQSKDALIFPQEASAERKLKNWRGEEISEPANNASSGLPSFLRAKMINRRNGHVV